MMTTTKSFELTPKSSVLVELILTPEDEELATYIRAHRKDSAELRNQIDAPNNKTLSEHNSLIEAERILNRG